MLFRLLQIAKVASSQSQLVSALLEFFQLKEERRPALGIRLEQSILVVYEIVFQLELTFLEMSKSRHKAFDGLSSRCAGGLQLFRILGMLQAH